MLVKNLKPKEHLAAFVDRILVFENKEVIHPFVLPLYPNGVPSLLFTSSKGTFGNKNSQYLTLFGQTILPETVCMQSNFTLIAYFFKPQAILSLFGISAKELTDKPIDANLIASLKSDSLQEQLMNAKGHEEMLTILDAAIFSLSEKSKTKADPITYAAQKIAVNPSGTSLIALQNELFLTERTFQRRFEKTVGIAPNIYKRICQFNAAFTQLNQRKFNTLSDIAYNNGYADQSHFIRSFKEFTSITPGDYFKIGT